MRTRRDVLAAGLFAGLAASVSAGSYVVGARRALVPLSRGRALEGMPAIIGPWTQEAVSGDMVDPIVIDEAFAEALRIYDREVQREYAGPAGRRIMVNAVFMRKVAQEAKFHWPEFCYATQGFKVKRLGMVPVTMPTGAIHASRFLAVRDDRYEVALYVTRVGDTVPAGGGSVRMAIFRNSFGASLPDGVLLRVSTFIEAPDAEHIREATDLLTRFLAQLVARSGRQTREMLVGEHA